MNKKILINNVVPFGLFFFLSLIIGLFSISHLGAFPVISDFLDYDTIALSLIKNHTYLAISSDALIYPPGYPIFLSILYITFKHSYTVIYVCQFILTGIIGFIYYKISTVYLKMRKDVSLIVGLTVVGWPYMILYSQLLSSEIVFILFISLFLISFLKEMSELERKINIMPGFFLGLATLTRPVALLLPFWIIIFLYISNKLSVWKFTKTQLRKILVTSIIFIATISPWILYVYIKYDRFIPVASNLSFVFNKGNSSFEYLQTPGEPKVIETKETPDQLKNFVKAKVQNIFLFWNPGASGYHVDALIHKYPKIIFFVWSYKIIFIIFILTGLSAFCWFKTNKIVAMFFAVVFYFWAVHVVLFPFPRYTLPVIPIVITLAFFSIENIFKLKKNE